MSAKNRKEIRVANLQFALGMVACVVLGSLVFFMYVQSLRHESRQMEAIIGKYDKVYSQQMEAVARMDSLVGLMQMGNGGQPGASANLNNVIIGRKVGLAGHLDKVPAEDVLMYNVLMAQMNVFLKVKDSVRNLGAEEALLKADLSRCMDGFSSNDRQQVLDNARSKN